MRIVIEAYYEELSRLVTALDEKAVAAASLDYRRLAESIKRSISEAGTPSTRGNDEART